MATTVIPDEIYLHDALILKMMLFSKRAVHEVRQCRMLLDYGGRGNYAPWLCENTEEQKRRS